MSEKIIDLTSIKSSDKLEDNINGVKPIVENNLKRIVLQYEDHVRYLEGEDAQKWNEMCSYITGFARLQGQNPFDANPLDWRFFNNEELLDGRDQSARNTWETEKDE